MAPEVKKLRASLPFLLLLVSLVLLAVVFESPLPTLLLPALGEVSCILLPAPMQNVGAALESYLAWGPLAAWSAFVPVVSLFVSVVASLV